MFDSFVTEHISILHRLMIQCFMFNSDMIFSQISSSTHYLENVSNYRHTYTLRIMFWNTALHSLVNINHNNISRQIGTVLLIYSFSNKQKVFFYYFPWTLHSLWKYKGNFHKHKYYIHIKWRKIYSFAVTVSPSF